MVAPALAAARVLRANGAVTVVNVPVIKPLDTETVLAVATASRAVITAENHTIVGGLGSAVAEAMAEAALARPLTRIGLQDTFAEGAQDRPLPVHQVRPDHPAPDRRRLVRTRPARRTTSSSTLPADEGEYAPV